MDIGVTIYPWLLTPPAALLLKSLLVFAAAGILLFALHRSSAAARHLVCLLTLGAVLLLPLCWLSLPGWHLPVLAARQDVGPTPAQAPALPVREGEELKRLAAGATSSHGTGSSSTADTLPATSSSSSLTGRTPAKQGGGFLFLYALGLLLAATRPLLGLWGIRRLSHDCASIADAPTLSAAADCARLLGLQIPRLCRAGVPVPMTWGWRCPVIVLPSASADWPEDRLRSVLLHEMAHVKRRDWPGHRLADFACALLWFHPLVWLTARRLRAESELACDDLVLASGIPAPDYARHLLEIASALPRASRRSSAAIAMAQTSQIESRLRMILDSTRRRTLPRRALLFALIPGTAALVTLAVLRPDAKAQTFPSTVDTQMAGNISVQLAGVTDGNLPGNQWWAATGAMLPNPIYDPDSLGTHGFILPRTYHKYRNLIFAFRLPPTAKDVTTAWELPKSRDSSSEGTWITETEGHDTLPEYKISGKSGGTRTVIADYPFSASQADVKVKIASGPWTTVATQNVQNDWFGTTKSTAAGTFIFSSITKAQYERPAVTITTDQLKQDVRVVAVDVQGHETLPVGAGDQSTGSLKQMTVDFDEDPAKRIVEFRVQTRPFQEVEFKDIPLQPMASAQPVPVPPSSAPADFRKTYASGITVSVDALTRLPADGGQWWRPDGTSIPEPVVGRQGSAGLGSWSPEQHPRALLFTATAPRPVSFSEADQFFVDGKPLGPISTFDSPQQLQPGQPSPSSRYVGFPENAAMCTLRYGIAAGPWQTAGVQKVRFSPALLSPLNATPDADFNGNVELILAPQSKLAYKDGGGILHLQSFTPQPLGETARRIVAVDAKGVQTPLFITGSTGGDMNIIGLSFSEHSVLHNYNPKIVLAQVREFRLQTRPYEWKEFDNLALKPVQ